jgi:CBS domain-containing protein
MKLVQQLLERKGSEIITISRDASVFEAIKLMADHGVGSLLVMDGEDLVGILTERDYARKVILRGRSSETTAVGEIMTGKVITADAEQSVADCMGLMAEHRIRHLPVVNGGKVTGIISIGDLVNAIISDQQNEIEQLENYISG